MTRCHGTVEGVKRPVDGRCLRQRPTWRGRWACDVSFFLFSEVLGSGDWGLVWGLVRGWWLEVVVEVEEKTLKCGT